MELTREEIERCDRDGLSLCAVSNRIRRFKRPEYIAHRDFTPIRCLPDDCLLRDFRCAAAMEGRRAGKRSARTRRVRRPTSNTL